MYHKKDKKRQVSNYKTWHKTQNVTHSESKKKLVEQIIGWSLFVGLLVLSDLRLLYKPLDNFFSGIMLFFVFPVLTGLVIFVHVIARPTGKSAVPWTPPAILSACCLVAFTLFAVWSVMGGGL